MSKPARPLMRYHGGKWNLAEWVIGHFPKHKVYTESFGGAGSVLLQKPRSYSEVYNDLDGEVVNVFRVLRDPESAARLRELCELTPYSREDFAESYIDVVDPVEAARRTMFRSFAGFGSAAVCKKHKTGFRANSNRSGTTPAHDWRNFPQRIPEYVERLRGVVIEHRDAKAVMAAHDSPDTLHYVDPPYLWATRRAGSSAWQDGYRHELTDEQHGELLEFLRTLTGMVVLSGYPHESYDHALPGWQRIDRHAHADGARDRTECLWLNPAVSARNQPCLIEVSA